MRTFRGPEVCQLVGISYRQLDYWVRAGWVVPSVQGSPGRGHHRLWSERDLVELEAMGALADHGQVHHGAALVRAIRRSGLERGWAVGRGEDWAVARSAEMALQMSLAVGGPVWVIRLGDVLDRLPRLSVEA